jgi:hypothetical protein
MAVLVLAAIVVQPAVAALRSSPAGSTSTGWSTRVTPSQGPPPTVPGLTSGLLTPVPGPSPRSAQCADAWNLHAPRITLRWVSSLGPIGALVLNGTSTVGSSSSASPGRVQEASGPTCSVTVYFANGKGVHASGPWKDGRVPAWTGDLMTIHVSKWQNASVAADGTLHLH